jgi:uncharacterized membrane protein YesL
VIILETNWTSGRFYRFCDWMMKIAYVNLLWILCSLLGLVVIGIIPSTVALFTVIRKWLLGEKEVPIFSTFSQSFRTEFFKSNLLGIFIVLAGYMVYFDFRYLTSIQGTNQLWLSIPLVIITVFFFITMLYLLPVYVHYELTFFQYIKHSFYIGVANPMITLGMLVSCILLTLLFKYIPGFLPFFCPSLFVFVLMLGGLKSFRNIEAKQKLYQITP